MIITERWRTTLLSALPAMIVGVWTFYLSSSQIGWAIALSAGSVSFFVFRLLTETRELSRPAEYRPHHLRKTMDLLILLLYSATVATLVLVPPMQGPLVSDWSSISLALWIRLPLTLLLTMFLPGYAILRLLDPDRSIPRLAVIPTSFVLATCFTVLLTFPFSSSHTSTNLAILNLLGIAFLSAAIIRRQKSPANTMSEISSLQEDTRSSSGFLLASVVVFVCSCVVAVFFLTPWLRGDSWRHFADATSVMKYGLTSRGYYYPWFNAMLWSQTLLLSGFPGVNLVLISISLIFPISVVAYFATARSITRSAVLAGLSSVFWAMFAGFDWLGALRFHDFSNLEATALTYESGILYQPGFFGFDHLPFLVGTICLLLLITLFTRKDIRPLTRVTLIALVFYAGYMMDVEVMVIFLIGFLPIIAFVKSKNRAAVSYRSILPLLAALGMVALTDWISPTPVKFYLQQTYLGIWVIGVLAIVILSAFSSKLPTLLDSLRSRANRLNWLWLKSIGVYVYALSFLILLYSIPYLPGRPFFQNTPLYQYSFRLGTTGVLTLALLVLPTNTRIRKTIGSNLRFFGLILLALIAEAELTGWFGVFDQTRFFYPAFMIFCVLAAAGLVRLSGNLASAGRKRFSLRALAGVLLISLVLITGISSTVLSTNFWTQATGPWGHPMLPSIEERAGVEFLRSMNSPSQFTVATASLHWTSYDNQLVMLSGARVLFDNQLALLFGTKDPATAFRVLENQNVKYIWVSHSRIEPSYNSSYVMSGLVPNLHPVFQGSDIALYPVPSFHSPSGANVALAIAGNYVSTQEYLAPEMISMSGTDYQVMAGDDYSQLKSQTVFLTSDSWDKGWTSSSFLGWTPSVGNPIQSGGTVTYATPNDTSPYYDYYSPSLKINTTDQPYLLVRWRMPLTDPKLAGLELYVHGSVTGFHFIDLGYSGLWTLNMFDLRDFASSATTSSSSPLRHDLIGANEQLDGILFRTRVKGSYFQLASVAVLDNPFISTFSPTELASSGKNVIVLNTYGYGSIARLLGFHQKAKALHVDGLTSPSTTISVPETQLLFTEEATNATVISSYSFMGKVVAPFAYEKDWGRGKIIYLDVKPWFDALDHLTPNASRNELFISLGNIPKLIDFGKTTQQIYIPPKAPLTGFVESDSHITFDHADFSGKILINSSIIQVVSQVKSDNLTLDGKKISSSSEGGFYVSDLIVNGTAWSYIVSSSAELKIDDEAQGYSLVITGPKTTITIGATDSVGLSLVGPDLTTRLKSLQGRSMVIEYSSPIILRVRNPLIAVDGQSQFTSAWCDFINGKSVLARGEKVTMSGGMKLQVEGSSTQMQSGRILESRQEKTSGQSLSGLYLTSYLYAKVPWNDVLGSYWNLTLLSLLGTVYLGMSGIARGMRSKALAPESSPPQSD